MRDGGGELQEAGGRLRGSAGRPRETPDTNCLIGTRLSPPCSLSPFLSPTRNRIVQRTVAEMAAAAKYRCGGFVGATRAECRPRQRQFFSDPSGNIRYAPLNQARFETHKIREVEKCTARMLHRNSPHSVQQEPGGAGQCRCLSLHTRRRSQRARSSSIKRRAIHLCFSTARFVGSLLSAVGPRNMHTATMCGTRSEILSRMFGGKKCLRCLAIRPLSPATRTRTLGCQRNLHAISTSLGLEERSNLREKGRSMSTSPTGQQRARDPDIIMEDADLDQAVNWAAFGIL